MALPNRPPSPTDKFNQVRQNNNPLSDHRGFEKHAASELFKKPQADARKGILEKGVSREKLSALARKEYNPNVHISESERAKLPKELSYEKFGDTINDKDIARHLKDLEKEKYEAEHDKDKKLIGDKMQFWENLKSKM